MTQLLSSAQIRAARAMLGVGRPELAKRAGISLPTLIAVEAESSREPKISSLRAIEAALRAAGAEFNADGSVNFRQKAERFIIEPGHSPSAETVRLATMIVEAARKAKTPRGALG